MSFRRNVLVALASSIAGIPFASAAPNYTITDLGTLGGSTSRAFAINASGQVVGGSTTARSEDNQHAFLYSDGKMTDLGTLGGSESIAFAINRNGQVGGVAKTQRGKDHVFLYTNGRMTDLGTLGGAGSLGGQINANGDVVGGAQTTDGKPHAFLWRKGKMTDLGTFGGAQSSAHAISDSGLVVVSHGTGRWSLWSDGKILQPAMYPPFIMSGASAINSKGDVVGGGQTADGKDHAFLYSKGKVTDLGTAPGFEGSAAYAINAGGEVVGSLYRGGSHRPFHYRNGKINDLNTMIDPAAGWFELTDAQGINDSGCIVGYGLNPSGKQHAYLLTPIKGAKGEPKVQKGHP